ncbi:hypothetical protein [Vibrio owensii]|uniref:hypothetical protein n=1 Tax=Vibrio owensii TaxID=696485 RepID=UPI002FF3DEF6
MKSEQTKKYTYIAEPTCMERKPKELTKLIAHEAQKQGVLVTRLSNGGAILEFDHVLGYGKFHQHINKVSDWDTYMSMYAC